MLYRVEVLSSNLTPVTQLVNFVPLDKAGKILEFGSKLSNYGTCRFRVGTKDPLFTTLGDIVKPYAFHVRISRNNTVVWQGAIIDNPHRTHNYIEVMAYEYEFLLSNYMPKPDSKDKYPGAELFRQFDSGTIASNITAVINEAKATAASGPIDYLSSLQVGTVENPDFPAGFVDFTGAPLTGTWTFSPNFFLKFDFWRSVYFIIQQLGAYSNYDFLIDPTFTFKFQKHIGLSTPQVTFIYGNQGNISDYDSPRSGKNMATQLIALGADTGGTIIQQKVDDGVAQGQYGIIQGAVSFNDVKNANALLARANEQLRFVSTPDTELTLTLLPNADPVGMWGLGDVVNVEIKDHLIVYKQQRRIVGYRIDYYSVGSEEVNVQTNLPRLI